ncbi:MAG: tyrosine-protein phosphatase [Archangium sp.]
MIRATPLLVLLAACAAPPTVTPPSDGGCSAGGAIAIAEITNGRDLGGIVAGNGTATTQCGQVYRSAVLSRLRPDTGCQQFAALGIKTVIDLRVEAERQGAPNATCIEPATRQLSAPMPIPYNVSPADYLVDFHTDDTTRALFATLGDEANYPVLFHCTYGRDRTGIAAAMILLTLGVSREEILADYQRTAENGISTTPASLEAVLNEIDRVGGIEAHLSSIGVAPASLTTLRAKLQGPPQP